MRSYFAVIAIMFFNLLLFALYYGIVSGVLFPYGMASFAWADDFISPVAWFNPAIAFICIIVGMVIGPSEIPYILFEVSTNNPTRDAIIIVAVNVIFYSLLGFMFLRLSARAIDPMREHRLDLRNESQKTAKNA